jgi:hypothetical protein
MARNNAFIAQVRICTRGPGALIQPEDLLTSFDAVFRRASSVRRFVLRGETIPSRREVVLWIAAVRHEAASRADTSVLLLLRRALPEIERRKWTMLDVDERGFKTEAVFADFALAPHTVAESEMRRLEALKTSAAPGDALLATTELPARAFR